MKHPEFHPVIKKAGLTFLFLIIISLLFISCKKEDELSNEGVSEIAGIWTATRATFNGVDVVEEGGSCTMVIEENGRFELTIIRAVRREMVFTGRLGFDEEWLAVEYDTHPGEYEYYDVSYDENNLNIGANSEFDFDGDGTDEFVIFYLDMIK
jgi:hypothetical protein